MIVRKQPPLKQPKISEKHIIDCLASHFEWFRNLCFPNVYMHGGEMDLCVVTPSGYVWEIEIKLTLSDWKADKNKYKWKPLNESNRKYISRFYYAVPTELIDKAPAFVPPEAGLIEVYWSGSRGYKAKIIKPSTYKRGKKITELSLKILMKKVFYKYWAKRMTGL